MRVVHLVKTSIGATWALEQMRAQKSLGVDVRVVLPSDGPMLSRYKDAGIPVAFANLDPAHALLPGTAANNAKAALSSLAPNIIHSHFVQTTIAARLLLGRHQGPPRVFQVAGPLHLENRLTRLADIRSAGAQDYWVPACELSMKLLLEGGVAEHRMALAYHGMNPRNFLPRPAGKLRAELGIASKTPLIGMVAYMYAPKRLLGQRRGLKGHEDLIDAVAMLPAPFDKTICVFAGGPWGEKAKAYADTVCRYGRDKLGDRAVFLGTRSDVLDLYPDFDVAVHPSHSENLGGAVESMMMSVPTVASNVGGFPDIVIPRKTGWLAEPRNPADLAQKILAALRDRETAARIAKQGRAYVEDKLDIMHQTRHLIDFYEDILSRGKHARQSAY